MNESNKISKSTSIQSSNIIFLKKKFENFGNEDILNENNQTIGKITTSFLNFNKEFKIIDFNTKNAIYIEKKNKLYSKHCYLKNNSKDLIAIIKKNRFSNYPSKIWLRNSLKNKIYYAIGNFKQNNYKIISFYNNSIVANIKNIEKKNVISEMIHEIPQKYYSVNFLNIKDEKMLIIAFIICISILNNPSSGISDLGGFEREIARLRPFGPGKNLN